mgnify:CR=1 FL=1
MGQLGLISAGLVVAATLAPFAIAAALKEEHPEAYETLTTVHWRYANTSRNTDHVWYSPMIVLGQAGELLEVRIADFLRGPMMAPPRLRKPCVKIAKSRKSQSCPLQNRKN